MSLIINAGNTDDIRNSLRLAEAKMTIQELKENIEAEKGRNNRSTVIKMLQAAVKRKQKAATA